VGQFFLLGEDEERKEIAKKVALTMPIETSGVTAMRLRAKKPATATPATPAKR
jgi:hypothetical protein